MTSPSFYRFNAFVHQAVDRELKVIGNKLVGMAQMKAGSDSGSFPHFRFSFNFNFLESCCVLILLSCSCSTRWKIFVVGFSVFVVDVFFNNETVLLRAKELYSIVQSRCWQAFEDKLAGHKWCAPRRFVMLPNLHMLFYRPRHNF